jgi:hypothetical protein
MAAKNIIRLAIMKGTRAAAVVDEIVERRPGQAVTRDCDWIEDVTARPDIVAGTTYPFTLWDEYQKTLKKGGA